MPDVFGRRQRDLAADPPDPPDAEQPDPVEAQFLQAVQLGVGDLVERHRCPAIAGPGRRARRGCRSRRGSGSGGVGVMSRGFLPEQKPEPRRRGGDADDRVANPEYQIRPRLETGEEAEHAE